MLLRDSDSLLTFVSNVSGVNYKRVEEDFGDGFVRLDVAEAERRQAQYDIQTVEDIVVELLRNCRDAGAEKVFLATTRRDKNKRHLVVIDNGCGIPQDMQKRILESRVTSKLDSAIFDEFGLHGRGMALYSIKRMADKLGITQSQPNKGSIFQVIINTDKVTERKDQSSLPVILAAEGQASVVKGARNVPRVLLEFALCYPQMEIFYGSSAQVLATMYSLASKPQGSGSKTISAKDHSVSSKADLWRSLRLISDGAKLVQAAQHSFGLHISERNGWRIIGGEIKPLSGVLDLNRQGELDKTHDLEVRLGQVGNVAKYIPKEELEVLSKAIAQTFRQIELKYYVKVQGKPKVSKSKNKINITINLVSSDE